MPVSSITEKSAFESEGHGLKSLRKHLEYMCESSSLLIKGECTNECLGRLGRLATWCERLRESFHAGALVSPSAFWHTVLPDVCRNLRATNLATKYTMQSLMAGPSQLEGKVSFHSKKITGNQTNNFSNKLAAFVLVFLLGQKHFRYPPL